MFKDSPFSCNVLFLMNISYFYLRNLKIIFRYAVLNVCWSSAHIDAFNTNMKLTVIRRDTLVRQNKIMHYYVRHLGPWCQTTLTLLRKVKYQCKSLKRKLLILLITLFELIFACILFLLCQTIDPRVVRRKLNFTWYFWKFRGLLLNVFVQKVGGS